MTHKISLARLRAVTSQRPLGYYEEMMVSGRVEGDVLFIEDDAYVALRKKYTPKNNSKSPSGAIIVGFAGPGTELKKLLSKLGLKPVAGCKCNQRIQEMNRKGVEWCEQNTDTIVGWLKEEADRAKLPFLELGAKILIKRAIRNAKKRIAA